MLVVRTFSSPIYRVRVAKPLDEAERLAEIGGPLELELVDRALGPAVPILLCLRCAMTNHPPHGDMSLSMLRQCWGFLPSSPAPCRPAR